MWPFTKKKVVVPIKEEVKGKVIPLSKRSTINRPYGSIHYDPLPYRAYNDSVVLDDGSDFIASAVIGAITDNAILGGAIGGSYAGGMIGQAIADTKDDSPSYNYTPSTVCEAPDSTPSYDYSPPDTSYDSGSSDCGSGGGDF